MISTFGRLAIDDAPPTSNMESSSRLGCQIEQCWPQRCNLHQFGTDLPLGWPSGGGNIRQSRQEILISGEALFDGGLLSIAERDFLEQLQQMRLALEQQRRRRLLRHVEVAARHAGNCRGAARARVAALGL